MNTTREINYDNPTPEDHEKLQRLTAAAPNLLAALKKIAEGKGRYSHDPLTHAENTIEDMKNVARAAIAEAEGK